MWDTGRGKRHLVQAQWEVTEKEACDPGLFATRRTVFPVWISPVWMRQ